MIKDKIQVWHLVSNRTKMTGRHFLTIISLLVLINCTGNNRIIVVQISPEKMIVENKEIRKADFEKILRAIIEERQQNGVERSELTIDLRTDKETKRGELADVEVSLRRLNVKRVNYSTY